jgi:hypothetical protein
MSGPKVAVRNFREVAACSGQLWHWTEAGPAIGHCPPTGFNLSFSGPKVAFGQEVTPLYSISDRSSIDSPSPFSMSYDAALFPIH